MPVAGAVHPGLEDVARRGEVALGPGQVLADDPAALVRAQVAGLVEAEVAAVDATLKQAKQIIERTPFAARDERTTQVRSMLGEDALDFK